MTLSLILDLAVAALLVVTIVYALILNRRLTDMRRDRDELSAIAASFDKAAARASDSIARLKASTESLQEGVRKAESLRDDLAFLLDRGTAAADRLETAVRAARQDVAAVASPAPAPVRRPGADKGAAEPTVLRTPRRQQPRRVEEPMDAERDLLRAIRAAR